MLKSNILSNRKGYSEYKHCLIWNEQSNKEIKLSSTEIKMLLKDNSAWMLRNIYDWDCQTETNFWEIINDKHREIEELPSKTRNQIRRSLKDCDIRKISGKELIESDGYKVYFEAFKRYRNIVSNPVSREIWEKGINQESNHDYWGVFIKDTDNLIAWGHNTILGESINYNTLKAIPEFMNKHYPYFGLLFTMNNYYLNEKGYKYVSDGFRSITEHSNIQPFLEKNFLFRKAYCRMNLVYKSWFGLIIKTLYPFRNSIKIPQIKSILKFEEIRRDF